MAKSKPAAGLLFLMLTGCGFHPVYLTRDADPNVVEKLNQVAIDSIADRPGQLLRNDLIDRFYTKGRPSQPLYHLNVKINIAEEDLGVLANATTTLAAVHVYADYKLIDSSSKVVAHGTATSTAQYDKLASIYSTVAAHDSAIERNINEVSEQLTARVSLYFAEQPPAPEP